MTDTVPAPALVVTAKWSEGGRLVGGGAGGRGRSRRDAGGPGRLPGRQLERELVAGDEGDLDQTAEQEHDDGQDQRRFDGGLPTVVGRAAQTLSMTDR